MPLQVNLPRSFAFLFVLVALVTLTFTSHAQPETAQQIEQLLDKAAALHRFNGTALVTQKGKVVFEKAYGYQNVAQKIPNSAATIYQIGSTTKQFTAAVVLQLVEQGNISLDDKLGHYFPDFKAGREVTVQQLLSHTSGIYEIFRSPEFVQLDKSRPISKAKLLSFPLTKPLDFTPGTQFNYCNSGYHLLGQIIEQVTGKTYEQNMRDRLLKPLNMRHSGFAFSKVTSKDKATGYNYFSATSQVASVPWDSSVTYAGGALYSTVHDLLLWHHGLQQHRVLKEATQKLATTPVLNGYGLGCWVDSLHQRRIVSHGGNVEGFTSYFASIQEEDMCVILLNNIYNREIESIGQAIFSILLRKPYQFFDEVQLPVETLEKYVGHYDVNPNFQVTISRTDGQLFLRINKGIPTKIFADKEHSFFDKNEDRRIRFSGKKGQINSVTIMQGLSTKQGDKLAGRL